MLAAKIGEKTINSKKYKRILSNFFLEGKQKNKMEK